MECTDKKLMVERTRPSGDRRLPPGQVMHQAYKCCLICQGSTTGGSNSPFHPWFHTEEHEASSQSWSSNVKHFSMAFS